MRKITLWLLSTVAVVVLLFSYRTSTGGSGSPTTAAAAAAPSSSGSAAAAPSSGSAAASGRTYSGSVASTQWGNVQVTITVSDGKITAVDVPVYPDGNRRDAEINEYALPALEKEVIAAQSADIDTISGATVTSDGYRESLQAAIDAAHLS
ncbi:FMN-binding protein [Cryptosporangium phraense]|uniref:FMN-binding protein n=1 Tax=Cryptosporangium phraense TaxID=2593070 RepID=A0A545AL55_9ACTN|nr:FMN-binding protein [Cryptosporangium phraense]TQS42046.1 FMN-binding protein [Cryptosporangium phraense]